MSKILQVISCWFSKFVLLFPLRNGKASNITKIVEEQVFLVFGTPQVVICDNGKQFVAAEFQDMIGSYGSKIWYTPYYHAQANPTERVNKVIGTTIAAYIQDNHKEWDKHIAHIGYAIRTAVHEVTGRTPSYLFFGRETSHHGRKILPFDRDLPIKFNRDIHEDRLKKRSQIYEDVVKLLKKAYEINSGYYNKRRRICTFQLGDLVWKKTKPLSNASKNFMAKLSPKYEKAVISEKLSDNVYMLKSLRGKSLGKWHVCDLKRVIC
jgi:hypothetical protein